MADDSNATKIGDAVGRNVGPMLGRSFVPFTGPIFAIWAFFGPESFGTWFGTIVRAFRAAAGI